MRLTVSERSVEHETTGEKDSKQGKRRKVVCNGIIKLDKTRGLFSRKGVK